MEEALVVKGQKQLRRGYTTGTCAAAAAKAAMEMILSGEEVREVQITVPEGTTFFLETEEILFEQEQVTCAVRKDAGDDPDITNGILIYATASIKDSRSESGRAEVKIEGGAGVGRVTRKGLEQPVGAAAINRVPRRMIQEAVEKTADEHGFTGVVEILISVPEGKEKAKETFNPRLGIEGGISILGTTGIVDPMSEKALTDTIFLELKMKKIKQEAPVLVVPGNYGSDFLTEKLGISSREAVVCSNYIGETLDMAVVLGIQELLFIGHIGKFIKIAAGVMDTHSRTADARAEVFAAYLAAEAAEKMDTEAEKAKRWIRRIPEILTGITTDEMLAILEEEGVRNSVMHRIVRRIEYHMKERVKGKIQAELITFSNEWGILGKTKGADRLLEKKRKELDAWRENYTE